MTLNFVEKMFCINGNGTEVPTVQFYKRGFEINGSRGSIDWQDIIISGNTALTLVNAKADGLNYLKLYGKTIQESVTLPTGYTRLDYLQSNGNQYINTNIRALQRRALQIDFQYLTTPSATSYVGGEVMKGSGTSLTSMLTIGAYGSNKIVVRFSDNAVNTDIDCGTARHVVKVAEGTWEVDGVTGTFTPSGTISSSAYNIYLFGANRVNALFGSDPVRIFNAKIWDTGELRQDWYPCRRDSDGTLGMYDIVNDTFRTNAGTGTFTAGADYAPTPTENARIICNNGVLKLHLKSNYDPAYNVLTGIRCKEAGAWFGTGIDVNIDTEIEVEASNITTTSTQIVVAKSPATTFFRIVKAGSSQKIVGGINAKSVTSNIDGSTRFTAKLNKTGFYIDGTLVGTIGATSISNMGEIEVCHANYGGTQYSGTNITFHRVTIRQNETNVFNGVPRQRISDGKIGMLDTVSNTFFPSVGTNEFDSTGLDPNAYEVYIDGTTETVKDSLNNTATAENLYGVTNGTNTFTDVQEVLTGAISRNVGVKVFDGTEAWTYQSANSRFFCDVGLKIVGNRTCPLLCTHYQAITDGRALANVPDYSVYGATANNSVYLHDSRFTSANALTNYLKEQYNAGTPVILIFPLATPTTETVTGQTLTTQRGTNVIEITQASIDGLPLEVSYKAGVTVTVEEVENANLDDSVTVTIGE